jgi:hypothetical protein
MFKAVGFNFDNILIGFMAMGHAYFEVLGNITNKVFNWFLNLFDHKIVPNIPGNKPNNPSKSVIDYINSPIERLKDIKGTYPVPKEVWNPIDVEKPIFSLRETYINRKPSFDITPWYKDTSTWLYIIGVGCTVGLFYVGYKIYTDPSWIYWYLTTPDSPIVTPTTPKPGPSNLPPALPSPDITLTDSKGIGNLTKNLGLGISKSASFIKNKLNPFSYFSTTDQINDQYQFFMDVQNNPATANRNYYPFTEVNPFLPWYKKLKVAVFGEGTFDALQRLKDKTHADRIYESIKISKGKYTDITGLTPVDTPIAGVTTPGWVSVGVGIKPTFVNYADAIHDINIASKLNSITPIPSAEAGVVPIPPINTDNILSDVTEWKNYNVDTKTIVEASDFVNKWKEATAQPSSQVTLDIEEGFTQIKSYKTSKLPNITKDYFPIHENKFTTLD